MRDFCSWIFKFPRICVWEYSRFMSLEANMYKSLERGRRFVSKVLATLLSAPSFSKSYVDSEASKDLTWIKVTNSKKYRHFLTILYPLRIFLYKNLVYWNFSEESGGTFVQGNISCGNEIKLVIKPLGILKKVKKLKSNRFWQARQEILPFNK